jgi:hypothetical protein
MTGRDLWDMKLHEELSNSNYTITKVPGGWIYKDIMSNNLCFVPTDAEFLIEDDN